MAKLVAEEKAPLVRVAPSAKIVEPKRTRGQGQYGHWPNRGTNGHQLRCRASGCYKKLRRNDGIACSDACRQAIRDECELLLGILDGKIGPEELPPYMRTNRLKRKRTL